MENCLVKKLKGVVDNPNLRGLYSIETRLADSQELSLFLARTSDSPIKVRLVDAGSAYFTDSTGTENYGTEMVLPESSSITYHTYVKNATQNVKLIVDDSRYLSMWTNYADFSAYPMYYMTKCVAIINIGTISEDTFEFMSTLPINNTLELFYDYFAPSNKNPGIINAFFPYINIDELIWGGAIGSHESLVEAWWSNGKRSNPKGRRATINTPNLTLNSIKSDKALYYSFTSEDVTIYDALTGGNLVATYNGSVWNYNS